MDVWACARVETILENAGRPGWLSMMRDAHIGGFLMVTFNVIRTIDPEKVREAKRLLDEAGFGAIAIGVPLGHPEGLDTPCFTFHEGWHIRHDIDDELVRWCSAITPQTIADCRAHMETLRELGISAMLWDDDLRQGNYEGGVQGCFCDACLAEFAGKYASVLPRDFNRESLRPVITKDPAGLDEAQLALREAWMAFTCARVTDFMRGTDVEGVRSGIMVMHNGDRRHGIDIPAIRAAVPDCLFRVGELMFNDASFEAPGHKRALVEGVLRHMALMGDTERIYSESTVFPHGALTPENLKKKILLERKCGIEHINLMGVERMNSEAYYTMLRDNFDLFRETRKEFTPENLDSFDLDRF